MKETKGRQRKTGVLAAVIIIGVFVIVYLALSVFFNSHFWFRTVINGVECSGKNVEAVEHIIRKEINGYQLMLEERQEETERIESSAIDLHPVFDGSIEKALKSRSGFAWPVSLFKKTEIELETMVEYNQEKLEKQVAALQCMKPERNQKPEDAYISDYIEGKGYEIVPEVEGTQIDHHALAEVLHNSIVNLQESVSLDEEGCYVAPKVRADNEQLHTALEAMNQYVKAEITYEFGNKKEVLDSSVIHKWLSVSKDNQIQIDEEQAAEFVKELAAEHNTYGGTRSFATSYGATVQLYTNAYGWRIDQEEELAKLLENIRAGESVAREPLYKQRARSHEGNDYGGTYVEINLTAQHLYFYKNGALIVESDLVSGNLAAENGTPSGAYGLYYKETDRILRGEDYATPVDYWMPFNGGIGMHDATWRSDFGGSYYKTSGSHGCINLPYSVAKTIYANIESGDAVFVYELPGTESAKGLAQDAAAAVDTAIAAIGPVTLDSSGAIGAARAAYDALDDMAKGYVKSYDILMQAESSYAVLVAQQQEAQLQEEAKKEAQSVIDAIDGIGEVTADKAKEIKKIRKEYEKLSDLAKQYVTNIEILKAAEAALEGL